MLIGEISKSETEKIRVQIKEYKGKRYIDCRLHFENEKGEWIPTKKGLTLNSETALKMVEYLQRASKGLEGQA